MTQANSQSVEFWAVLINAPPSQNDNELIVEIRSNYESLRFAGGPPLATMKQQ